MSSRPLIVSCRAACRYGGHTGPPHRTMSGMAGHGTCLDDLRMVRSVLSGLEGGFSPTVSFKEAILKPFIRVMFVSSILTVPALAEKLVDPSTVAPEYREAAEKRRTEQVRQRDCAHKADVEKVMPRERTAFLLQCLEADAATK